MHFKKKRKEKMDIVAMLKETVNLMSVFIMILVNHEHVWKDLKARFLDNMEKRKIKTVQSEGRLHEDMWLVLVHVPCSQIIQL